jgi:hypothetical protein
LRARTRARAVCFVLSLAHSLNQSLTHSLSHSLTRTFTHSLTRTHARSLTHLLAHSLTHSLTHSPTHSLAHSLTHSLARTHAHTHTRTHTRTHARTHAGPSKQQSSRGAAWGRERRVRPLGREHARARLLLARRRGVHELPHQLAHLHAVARDVPYRPLREPLRRQHPPR